MAIFHRCFGREIEKVSIARSHSETYLTIGHRAHVAIDRIIEIDLDDLNDSRTIVKDRTPELYGCFKILRTLAGEGSAPLNSSN
jgi:hypothetical protein